MAQLFEKKISDEQRSEIVEIFYSGKMMQKDIAAKYGVSQSLISKIVNDPETMTRMLRATTANRVRAQIRVNNHLEEAVDTQIDLMRGEYEDQYKYLKQNAARDLLDRGGVRAEKEEKTDTRVIVDFGGAGGLVLGVPDHSRDNEESEGE